jgi:hypothetical protein
VEKMQKDMSYFMLATFADSFRQGDPEEERKRMEKLGARADGPAATWQGADLSALDPEEMEGLLADTVLKEFKTRLGRIGIEYQTPARP